MEDPMHSKYWNDQIKSLIGPCMVTFAIPLTIPGLTITLVAFSDEKSFPVYGTLHITGLIILIISVFLIIFGCILKFVWKPIILPDIERQLSPRESFRKSNERRDSFYRSEIERIQRENLRKSEPVPEKKRKNSSTKTEETVLDAQKGTSETVKSIDVAQSGRSSRQISQKNTEQEETQRGSGNNSLSALPLNDFCFQSPRGGRLPPIETTDKGPVSRGSRVQSSDQEVPDVHVSRGSRLSDSVDGDLMSRKKKKKRKRHRKSEEYKSDGGKEDEEDEEEKIERRSDGRQELVSHGQSQLSLPKVQKSREHLLEENISGESALSSNRSLLNEESSDSGKKRKRRRKKKTLSALRQESQDPMSSVQSACRSSSRGSRNDDDVTNRNLSDSESPHPVDST